MVSPTKKAALLSAALLMVLVIAGAVYAKDVPRMTVEDLKASLGKEDVVVVDVRAEPDWTGSQTKIQGAVREEPGKVDAWKTKYPKDKTLVLYCA